MKRLAFPLALLALSAAQAQGPVQIPASSAPGSQALAPLAVQDLIVAQPFTLSRGYVNTWSKQRETVTSGVIVVLQVDPSLATRRDSLERVLYAGSSPLQRLSDGARSGRVIGIVPNVSSVAGLPIWFGQPNLPERVTPALAEAERARATEGGIRPLAADKTRSATRPAVAAQDLSVLLRDRVAPLVLEHSPEDKDLASAWRAEPVRAPSKPQR
jgi:hypothetical protein